MDTHGAEQQRTTEVQKAVCCMDETLKPKKRGATQSSLGIQGHGLKGPEFRSIGGRLIARGVPTIADKLPIEMPERSLLTPPLLCFQESDMVKRNLVSAGEEDLPADIKRRLPPMFSSMGKIRRFRTNEDNPIVIEQGPPSFGMTYRCSWYVSSADVLVNGDPVVLVKKSKR